MLEKLADLDRVEGGKACFTRKNGWKPLTAPDLERSRG
jgi:hypothetical protein